MDAVVCHQNPPPRVGRERAAAVPHLGRADGGGLGALCTIQGTLEVGREDGGPGGRQGGRRWRGAGCRGRAPRAQRGLGLRVGHERAEVAGQEARGLRREPCQADVGRERARCRQVRQHAQPGRLVGGLRTTSEGANRTA